MDQIHTFYNFAGQARIRKEQFGKINENLEKTKKEDEMSYKKSGNKNVIKHTCNKINKDGKCRFAIDLSELKKPSSKSNLYFLICKDQNKGYLVPSGLVKKYSKYFAGSGHKFPFSINPSTNRIEYGGESENISMYCKLGKKNIELILNKFSPESIRAGKKTKTKRISAISMHYRDKYNTEQEEIVNRIKKEVSGKGDPWNKYKGGITAQIIIHHLRKYLPNHLKIVGHDYFVHNNITEYDAMIVKSNSKDHYNTYKPEDVVSVIEIKESGFFKENIPKLKKAFGNIKRKFPHIQCLLIIAKCSKIKQLSSFENAFILSNPNTWSIKNYYGQWESLIDFIKGL